MAKMTSKTLKNKMSKAQKDIEKLKNQLVKDGEKLFKISCKEIFDKHDFESFAWCQFTPYFSDGDPCQFGANTDSIYINGEDDEEYLYSLETLYNELKNKERTIDILQDEIEKLEKKNSNEWEIKHKKDRIELLNKSNLEEVKKRFNFLSDVNELLSAMDNDTLESMFGDHAKVIVTKDGFDVESYEHD